MRCVCYRGIAAFTFAFLLPAFVSSSTLIPKQSDEVLAKRAPLILLGSASEARSQWVDRRLVTLVDIDVSEVLKGNKKGPVTVIVPGGLDTSGAIPISQSIDGSPEFRMGERVLVFLKPVPDMAGHYLLVGSSQGKLTIEEGPKGLLARRNLSGVQLYDGKKVEQGISRTIPLSELRKVVQQVVDKSRQDS